MLCQIHQCEDQYYVEYCPMLKSSVDVDTCLYCPFFLRSFQKDGSSWIECGFEEGKTNDVGYTYIPVTKDKLGRLFVECPVNGNILLAKCVKCERFYEFFYDHDRKYYQVCCVSEEFLSQF